jgi:hypothetical protein
MSVPVETPVTDVAVEPFVNGVVESNPVSVQNLSTEHTGPVFTVEDINKIREQEKAKLYPEIERLKNDLKEIRERESERVRSVEEQKAAAEAEARAKAEAEMDAKELLKAKEREWEERFNQQAQLIAAEKAEREQSQAVLQMERQYQELMAYRQARLDEMADQIMPELRDLATGSTVEEIDASIANLVDRTARIVDNVKQATQSARQQMPGARVTYPANGPLDTDSNNQSFTPEQVAGMSMSDYAKYRERLLGRPSSAKGLFG